MQGIREGKFFVWYSWLHIFLAFMNVSTQAHYFGVQWTSLAVILFALLFLVSGHWKEKKENLFKSGWMLAQLPLYPLLLIGMLWTKDTTEGSRFLELRIPMLLMPLIFASFPAFDRAFFDKLIAYFMAGIVLVWLLTFRKGFGLFDNRDFFVNYASEEYILLHRSHFGLVMQMLSLWLLEYWIIPSNTQWKRWVGILAILIAQASVWYIAAKMAMAGGVIAFFFYGLMWLRKKGYRLAFNLGLSSIIFGIVALTFLITINLDSLIRAGSEETGQVNYLTSFAGRADIWGCFVEGIKENNNLFFGVGSGDVRSYMDVIYCRHNSHWCNQSTNCHNQYIEEVLRLGIPGLLVLLLFFFPTLILSIRKNESFLSALLLLMLVCMATESYISRYSGLFIFTYLTTLIATQVARKDA